MSNKSRLYYNKEPVWFCNRLKRRLKNIPSNAATWINETRSITQRLRHHYTSRICVQVLNNQWQRAYITESQLLKSPYEKYMLTREVLLYTNDIPLIIARTVIPATTLSHVHKNLSHLGNRPLGEVIFSYPYLQRLALEMTQIQKHQWRHSILQTTKIEQAIWGRRTIYAIHYHPLLVSEFFLPAILNH